MRKRDENDDGVDDDGCWLVKTKRSENKESWTLLKGMIDKKTRLSFFF